MSCRFTLSSWLLAVSAIGFVALDPVKAGSIVITGGSTTIAPGGIGTVDFMISADTPVNLASFSLQLQINIVTGNAVSDLSFVPNATFPGAQQPAVFDRGTYVFFNKSGTQYFDPASSIWTIPVGYAGTVPNTTISGSDFNFNGTDFGATTVPALPGGFLLASVGFSLNNGAPLDSSFTISIVTDGTNFTDDLGSPIAFISTAAVVTVGESVETIPVPEPAAMTLLGIGGFGMAAYARYRQKRKKQIMNTPSKEQ